MQVNVIYNKFNTDFESAIIPLENDKSFNIATVGDGEDVDKKLEIKSVDGLTQEEISLQMTLEEAKQFNLLISQFLRQL